MRWSAPALILLTLLAGCAGTNTESGPSPVEPVPVQLELGLTGRVAPIVDAEGMGEIAVTRDGADDAVVVAFRNGAVADFALAPGGYELTSVGPLRCEGVLFNVAPEAGAKALGTLRGEIIETDYYVARLAGRPATPEQVQSLASAHGIAADAVDAAPMLQTRAIPCYIHKHGPGETWRDRPLGEQILLGIGFAGFCAVAVATGGFCAF